MNRRNAYELELARVREVIRARSGGKCEMCFVRPAVHTHHRKSRSQGGQNTEANLLDVCAECHTYAHAHLDESYLTGVLVRPRDDPALVDVLPWEP